MVESLGVVSQTKVAAIVAGDASVLALLRSVVGDFGGMCYSQAFGSQDVYVVQSYAMPGFRFIVQFCGCVVLVFSENERFL